jgi:PTS system nitrogen regulatory IIA component
MNLTLRDVAAALQVPESTVLRWISEKNLPAQHVAGTYHFNRVQLLEWAAVNRQPLTGDAFRQNGSPLPRLDAALRAGRIVDNLPGSDLANVYRALVDILPLPPDQEREEVYQMFLGRESRGSTAIGEGLALPHPRHPIVTPGQPPSVTVCFLAQPLDLKAPDRKPVHTLLALLTPTVRVHVHLLARLISALREPGFRAALLRKDPAAICAEAERLEEAR